ncbi:MAG: hypothetical protein M3R27_04210 [Bacteroidota bacterium]|nr:hypothetical protein [Bacteroidota bacterium]
METLKINSTAHRIHSAESKTTSILMLTIQNHLKTFEEQRLGWMAMMILVQTCLGSLAVMHILMNGASDALFISCTVVTMACNSILIAQGPAKWCLGSFYLSIIVNTLLILTNI